MRNVLRRVTLLAGAGERQPNGIDSIQRFAFIDGSKGGASTNEGV